MISVPARRVTRAKAAVRQAGAGLVAALTGHPAEPAWTTGDPRRQRQVRVTLAAATLGLAVLSVASVRGGGGPPHQPATGLERVAAAAAVTPLLLAARAPRLAWRLALLALLIIPLVPAGWWGGWPWGPAQILATLAVFFLAGIGQPRPVLWGMWFLTLVPWWLWLAARLSDLNGPGAATLAFTLLSLALDSAESGLLARTRLAAETGRANAERDRRAALEERTRIARELHDVVAHHMSLIAVRAETAGYRLPDVPQPALTEFGSLSQLAREALADMRRLLGVLRQDLPAGLAPQPQLSDLPALVDAAREAGVAVSLTSSGSTGELPESVSLCAYRIVQESLSNASQHAPGAAISISVDQDSTAIRLQITNGPAGQPGPASQPGPADEPGPGTGHGLAGMRERVALLGGSLTVGPVPRGGFEVTAVLPLAEAA